MLTVVYPGTFDPFTRGHEDLVRRASKLFDRVIVGVADSAAKQPYFTTAERVEMAREVVAAFSNVEVKPFSGLLMDFVHGLSDGLGRVVRGHDDDDFLAEIHPREMLPEAGADWK